VNYFFVFQNKSYKTEKDGSYLWSPKLTKDGKKKSHWERMKEVTKGDIILHCFNQRIVAYSTAMADVYSSKRPIELSAPNLWEEEGWRVDVSYTEIDNPIHIAAHISKIRELQPEMHAPFNSINRGNTGYLFQSNARLTDYLLLQTEQIQTNSNMLITIREIRERVLNEGIVNSHDNLDKNRFPFRSYSWELISKNVFIKTTDKSVFEHNGSGIPKDIRAFFQIEHISSGMTIPAVFVYKGIEFTGRFVMDLIDASRTRVFWEPSLTKLFIEEVPDWEQLINNGENNPLLRFQIININEHAYNVELIVPSKIDEYNRVEIDYDEGSQNASDGKAKYFYVKKYERNPANRKAAIKIHGLKCKCCGFDFSRKYGQHGEGYIEVHHIVPLSSLQEEITINPKTDLFPVCANCHRMIHHKANHVLSIEELKEIINSQ